MSLHLGSARLREREVVLSPLPTRSVASATPDDVTTAIRAAEGGNLLLAADLAKDIGLDPRAGGVLRTRTLGLFGLPLEWRGIEPDKWSKLATVAELVSLHRWGLLFGVGFAQILPSGKLRTWHPRWFRYDAELEQWYVTHRGGEDPIDPGDGSWIIYTPYGEFEPWFEGLWLSLAIPYLIKQYAVHDRARASEIFGSAMIAGTAPEGASEKRRKKWLSDLQALARSARIVLPHGYDLKLLEAQGQTWGIYSQATEWANEAITIAIAGQIVTTEGQSGFSRGDIHEAIAHSLISFGATTISDCLEEQYVVHVWPEPAKPVWDVTPPKKVKEEAEGLGALADAIKKMNGALNSEGLKVDARAILDQFAVPIRRLIQQRAQQAIQFAPTDIAKFVKINEARESVGLGDWTDINNKPDIRGNLSIFDFVKDNDDDNVTDQDSELRLIAAASRRNLKGIRFCRNIDVSKAPKEFLIFDKGKNKSDHGVVQFTKRSAQLVMKNRGNRDVMIDLEHLAMDPESKNFDPDARGWARLEIRNGALWAVDVRWTNDGKQRIEEKRQRWISPAFRVNRNGEITSLINVALTALPAMHNLRPLIAASNRKSMSWEELLEMLGLGPDATLEEATQALAELERAAAAAAEDMGAQEAADAIDEAADATEDAADVAAEADAEMASAEDDDDDEDEKAASTVFIKMLRHIKKLSARIDQLEREQNMAGCELSPKEQAFLNQLPPKMVKQYTALNNSKKVKTPKPRKKGSKTNASGLTAEEVQFCNTFNMSHEEFKKGKASVAKADSRLKG